jgi:hypothetical protein
MSAAILRARATFARFEPRRLATSIAQRLSFENRVMRASRTLAASSPDAWGRLNVMTPFHHLSGDSHLSTRSVQGPLRHLVDEASCAVPITQFARDSLSLLELSAKRYN